MNIGADTAVDICVQPNLVANPGKEAAQVHIEATLENGVLRELRFCFSLVYASESENCSQKHKLFHDACSYSPVSLYYIFEKAAAQYNPHFQSAPHLECRRRTRRGHPLGVPGIGEVHFSSNVLKHAIQDAARGECYDHRHQLLLVAGINKPI